MSKNTLSSKTKTGLVWSSIERFAAQGVQFLFGVILARLLSADDYGIIAMPMIFLAIAQSFVDSGFANAIIRKEELTQRDLSTAFFFNIIVGVFCYFVLFCCSPIIADFYSTPILSSLLKVTSLVVLFNSLAIVQQALLTRTINFKKQAYATLSAAILSGLLGVWMAVSGYGVWALVIQQTGSSFIRLLIFWCVSKWRPTCEWSNDSFHYLWGFGSKMLASSLLDTIYKNIYPLVIGKFYTSAQLGYYTRSLQFSQLPSTNITGILKRVTYPVMSSIQNDDDKLSSVFQRTLRVSAFVMFPLMFFLFGVSSPLINIILTEKWAGSIPLLQILCLGMIWYPIDALNLNLLMIKGKSDLFLRLEVIKKIVGAIILMITIPMGIQLMCVGFSAYCFLEIVFDTFYTGRFFDYGLIKQLRDLFPSFILSCIILSLILVTNEFVENQYLQLLVDSVICLLFIAFSGPLFRMKEYYMLKEFMTK